MTRFPNLTALDVEGRAHRVRLSILSLLASLDASVDVAVIAIADVLADMAVQSDLTEGRGTLDDRLNAFTRRFERTYEKVRTSRETEGADGR